MTGKPLWQMSAVDLATNIIGGEVSCEEAVTAAVERMRAVNPKLNAVVDDLGDAAIEQARDHDETLAGSGPIGPLHGVPVTIKENVDQKGCTTPNGVEAYANIVAPDDAPLVKNLKAAGAIVIGRTNTPEFSFRATTTNALHGRTYNPWNDHSSSGGSSGGASTAVMAGMGAIAHGNDIGGSLRYPAAATGSATVKPGLGRVPAWNPSQKAERGLLAQVMSVQGVICREVRDVRAGMQALIKYDPRDPWMVPMGWDSPRPEGKIKVAFTRNTYEFDLHPAVEKALDTARDCLVDAGYEVVEADMPELREAGRDGGKALFGEVNALLRGEIDKHGTDELKSIFANYDAYYQPPEGAGLLQLMAKRNHYHRQFNLFFEDYPLVLTPFLPTPTYDWDRDAQGMEGVIETLGAGMYSVAFNYTGLPAGNIAANYNDGLPVGVQIVGPRFREDMILDALEEIESRVGVMAEHLFAREA
jgi:amidase